MAPGSNALQPWEKTDVGMTGTGLAFLDMIKDTVSAASSH